jgi:rhamnogalacturonyl hydrolase YesR
MMNLALALLLLMAGCAPKNTTEAPEKTAVQFDIDQVFEKARTRYLAAAESLKDSTHRMPYSANADGSWETVKFTDWMSGFFPGILWYIYENTQDAKVLEEAKKWTALLEDQQFMDRHHDIGFMMFCSYGNGYRLTGEPGYLPILVQSARTALNRYNPIVGTIKSWNYQAGEHPTIIDNMMNLELLLWVAKQTNDKELLDVSHRHAQTTIAHQFRDDFSSYHVVTYDSLTGNILHKRTAQGYSDNSMWARGQAWGIYGFTMMYRETEDPAYLDIASKTARLFIERLPADYVPYWDFDAPDIPNTFRDASAGAIAAGAFLELSTLVASAEDQQYFYNAGVNVLNALTSPAFLADDDSHYQCLLLHSAYNANKNYMTDVNKSYADYYYLEALLRLKRLQQGLPLHTALP